MRLIAEAWRRSMASVQALAIRAVAQKTAGTAALSTQRRDNRQPTKSNIEHVFADLCAPHLANVSAQKRLPPDCAQTLAPGHESRQKLPHGTHGWLRKIWRPGGYMYAWVPVYLIYHNF